MSKGNPSDENQCCGTFERNDPKQQELSRILAGFKQDILGVISLGKNDGVLRSLTADRTVLSAEGLSPELIKAFLNRVPDPEWRKGFENVDGTKTPKEKWFHPDEGELPAPLPSEKRKIEEHDKSKLREIVAERSK